MDETYLTFTHDIAVEDETAYRALATELTFIGYLLLGQVVLLLLWRLVRLAAGADRARSTRLNLAFALYLLVGQVVLFRLWPPLVSAYLTATNLTLADVVSVVHFGFVVAMLVLQLAVMAGWWAGWQWTRNFWLRLAQVVLIEIVVGQAFVRLECPLTTLEKDLRGGSVFNTEGSHPVAKFCNGLLYSRQKPEFWQIAYGSFGLLVLATWILWPPTWPGQPDGGPAKEEPEVAVAANTG